jgi:hypothetical protein
MMIIEVIFEYERQRRQHQEAWACCILKQVKGSGLCMMYDNSC